MVSLTDTTEYIEVIDEEGTENVRYYETNNFASSLFKMPR